MTLVDKVCLLAWQFEVVADNEVHEFCENISDWSSNTLRIIFFNEQKKKRKKKEKK